MFSIRNNSRVILAIALLGIATPLMPMDLAKNLAKGTLKAAVKANAALANYAQNIVDGDTQQTDQEISTNGTGTASRRNSRPKGEAETKAAASNAWVNVSPTIHIPQEMAAKIKDAAEVVKKHGIQLFRQNEMRTFLDGVGAKLTEIIGDSQEKNSPEKNKKDTNTLSLTPTGDGEVKGERSELQIKMDLVTYLKNDFASKLKKITDEQVEQIDGNPNDLHDPHIAETARELEALKAKFGNAVSQENMPNLKAALIDLRAALAQIKNAFAQKSLMGGMSNLLGANITELGLELNKVVIKLSSDLSEQLKFQLNEVVGQTALIKLVAKLTAISDSSPSYGEILLKIENIITEVEEFIKSIQYTESPAHVDENDAQPKAKRDAAAALEDSDSTQTKKTETKPRVKKGLLQVEVDKILAALKELPPTYKAKPNTRANRNELLGKLSNVAHTAEGVLDRHGGMTGSLFATVDRLNTGFDKTLRRFVGYACCGIVATYSTIFLMNRWQNPTDRKIGIGTLTGSLLCIPLISRLVNYFCR